ncbi:hypothetical protein N0V94_008778 [Neodidymelliopsis sp. IMI 364377]|nr:hypothetical protein N0V94_008778 [Neodidymelliopsis sp. IMI 364377]
MPYPVSTPGKASRPARNGKQWPVFPGIPIFLETHDERAVPKTYGTTPTTPTTPEVLTHGRPVSSSSARLDLPEAFPAPISPATTIQTSSNRSSVWPVPELPPEIQHQAPRRPTLNFFPSQRPRVRLDGMPTLQIPQFNEKTPMNPNDPGLGITNAFPKPPSIEVTSPINEKTSSSFNIAQRIEEKLWRYSASGNILKRWLLEILSWLFSALCMSAVIGVLIWLRDQPLSKWTLEEKTHLTLNTYISILSKMAGAALILPVSEALGQLKWSWFLEHSKQMWDFEIFDNASPAGADSVYRHEVPVIHECLLSWCVQTVISSYEEGKYTENIVSTYQNMTGGSSPWESLEIPEDEGGGIVTFYMQNISITPPASNPGRSNSTIFNATYGTNNVTTYNVMNVFDDFFPSYYTTTNTSDTPVLRYKNYANGAATRQLAYSPWQAPSDVSSHVERLAVAMTNVIRSDVDSNEMLQGTAYRMETYVQELPGLKQKN